MPEFSHERRIFSFTVRLEKEDAGNHFGPGWLPIQDFLYLSKDTKALAWSNSDKTTEIQRISVSPSVNSSPQNKELGSAKGPIQGFLHGRARIIGPLIQRISAPPSSIHHLKTMSVVGQKALCQGFWYRGYRIAQRRMLRRKNFGSAPPTLSSLFNATC